MTLYQLMMYSCEDSELGSAVSTMDVATARDTGVLRAMEAKRLAENPDAKRVRPIEERIRERTGEKPKAERKTQSIPMSKGTPIGRAFGKFLK